MQEASLTTRRVRSRPVRALAFDQGNSRVAPLVEVVAKLRRELETPRAAPDDHDLVHGSRLPLGPRATVNGSLPGARCSGATSAISLERFRSNPSSPHTDGWSGRPAGSRAFVR